MQELHAGIDRVIKIARSLRDTAGELGKLDLKSQVIDEISILQELRDEMDLLVGAAVSHDTAAQESGRDTETLSSSGFKLADNTMAVIQPSGDTDTYQIAPIPEPEPEPSPAPAAEGDATAETTASAEDGAEKSSKPDSAEAGDADRSRAAQAELRIAELEPLHAAAVKRVNAVLTPEQNRIRVKATKAARAAGRTGADARNYIYSAMKLTEQQKVDLAAAKKELSSIRQAIAQEIEFLLDEDQKKRVAEQAHIQLPATAAATDRRPSDRASADREPSGTD